MPQYTYLLISYIYKEKVMEVQKVYIVMGSDSPCYGHESWVCKVFTDKAMAEKYCEVHNELEEMYNFYVDENEISTFDLNTEIKQYYSYTFDTDFETLQELIKHEQISQEEVDKMSSEEINDLVKQLNHPDQNFCNDPEELTSRIYDQDLAKDIQTYGGDKPYMHGTIYSINSYQEAKDIALKIWQEQYENTKHKLC